MKEVILCFDRTVSELKRRMLGMRRKTESSFDRTVSELKRGAEMAFLAACFVLIAPCRN